MKNLSVNMRAMALVLFAFASYNIADAFLKHTTNLYFYAEAALYPSIFYAGIVLLFHKKFGGAQSIIKTQKKKLLFLRGIFGSGCYLCFVLAIRHITLAEVYTLILTAPFWIALMSIFFFKEVIGWHRWLAIAVGFIGVLIILRPGFISVQPASLLTILAAICFGFFVIFTKKIGSEEPLFNMVIVPIIVETIVFVPLIFANGEWQPPQMEHLVFFAAAGVFYLIGTSLSSVGFASGESSLLAPLHYSQIIWGALIGYFIFQETPDNWTFAGASIIVFSGIYLVHREHLAHKASKP